jgi:hypothetical protein
VRPCDHIVSLSLHGGGGVSDEHGSAADTRNWKLIYVVAVPLLEEVAEVGAASGVAFAELELMAHYGRA